MQQTCVDFVKRTYRVLHGPGSYDDRDPVERICWLVNFRDKAEKMLGTKQIEGREAVGFQIRASQFGDNPQENRVRVWFDTQTRLTVLTESEYRELDGGVTVEVQDQINWNPGLADEAFLPRIPEGFIDATSPQERQAETSTALDPDWWHKPSSQWKDTVVHRVNQIKRAGWRRQDLDIDADGRALPSSTYEMIRFVSGAPITDYRIDHFQGSSLQQIEWHVQQASTEVITCVQMDRSCYWTRDASSSERQATPLSWLRTEVEHVDRAERTLPPTTIDGHACIGFEMRASAYGDNPDRWIDRLWFDTASGLPVRMEQEMDNRNDPTHRFRIVSDQFDFTTEAPDDFFCPRIPTDCTRIDPPK